MEAALRGVLDLEQRQFCNALVVTAVSADVILLLVSAVDEQNPFPPYLTEALDELVKGVLEDACTAANPVKCTAQDVRRLFLEAY